MRLIEHYSLLPFMTPWQFYYPRVVLQFYHSMTSRGAPSLLELQFTIDDRPGILRAVDISAALLQVVLMFLNATGTAFMVPNFLI